MSITEYHHDDEDRSPCDLALTVAAVLAAFFVPITIGGWEGAAKPGAPTYTQPLRANAIPPVPPRFGGTFKDTALAQ
jgi:hypothetical protein